MRKDDDEFRMVMATLLNSHDFSKSGVKSNTARTSRIYEYLYLSRHVWLENPRFCKFKESVKEVTTRLIVEAEQNRLPLRPHLLLLSVDKLILDELRLPVMRCTHFLHRKKRFCKRKPMPTVKTAGISQNTDASFLLCAEHMGARVHKAALISSSCFQSRGAMSASRDLTNIVLSYLHCHLRQ